MLNISFQFIKPWLHTFLILFVCMNEKAAAFGTQEDQIQNNPITTEFKKFDTNHDGFLSREETNHDSEIAVNFDGADLNHDHKLSLEEYVSAKRLLQQARTKVLLDDASVTAKVKTGLLQEDGLRSLSISVETHHGVVILSGFVDTEQQVRRAVEIASGVRGVASVKNSLLLKG